MPWASMPVTLPQHMKIETPMQSVVAVRRARLSKR